MATKWKDAGSSTMSPVAIKKRKEVLVRSLNVDLEIVEVSWQSGLEAARDKSKILAPHWSKSLDVNEEDSSERMRFKTGSKRPGVYLVAGKGTHKVLAKVNVTKSSFVGEATLQARLGSLSLKGDFEPKLGEQVVTLIIENPPKDCQHLEGDATWSLEAGSAGNKSLNEKTRLEVFFILDKPPSFYSRGVWVEALRLVFKRAGVSGMTDPNKIAGAIAKYCHTTHGMRYDTTEGGSKFNANGRGASAFNLMKYILKKGKDLNTVNCYDQAAAVQSFVGALGIHSDWIFLGPYGFINKTDLVGVGLCNNPFFMSNDTMPVVADDDPNRTAFGNHAFVSLAKKILDACAGPHMGTASLQQYMKVAIDPKRTVPVVAPGFTPGEYFAHLEGLPNPQFGLTGVE